MTNNNNDDRIDSYLLAANIGFCFNEFPFLERIKCASEAGYYGIEVAFPYEEASSKDLKTELDKYNLEITLINSYPNENLGFAAVPNQQEEFLEIWEKSYTYAVEVGCPLIHIMAGKFNDNDNLELYKTTFINNLTTILPEAHEKNLTIVLEPMNRIDFPNYYLNSNVLAVEIINQVKNNVSEQYHSNIGLQFDFYHTQINEGNLSHLFHKYYDLIQHVQISQVHPINRRHEPDYSGEINYSYIFKLFSDCNYNKWIGAEYKPSKENSFETLSWREKYIPSNINAYSRTL
eukprot:TRINITY_DN16795_c0_g1_i1.p1 TRINITY_DN16795_c0_g1~~TRINITY_DN16795_c0_g1_i1.p1  ORF type:complete len:290 (-),score=71.68 TRINITY_DN16795_c0_g1_i1:56-925(-)